MYFNKIACYLFLIVVLTACESGSNIHYSESEDAIFQISGRVYGLNGNLEISLNDVETIEMVSDDFYRFRTRLKTQESYTVSVSAQPEGQECVVENSEGVIEYQSVSDVNVYCEDVESKNKISLPSNLSKVNLSIHAKTLTLDWPAIAGADYYKIIQSSIQSKVFNTIATNVKQTSYKLALPQLKNWDSLAYSIVACGKFGCTNATQPSKLNAVIVSLENTIELPYSVANFSKIRFPITKNKQGDRLFIGAPNDSNSQPTAYSGYIDGLTESSGAVLIYQRLKSSWGLINYLKAPFIDRHDEFGSAVALLDDGKFLAVGSPNDDSPTDGPHYLNSNEDSGTVFLYSQQDNFKNIVNIIKHNNVDDGIAHKYFGRNIKSQKVDSAIVIESIFKGEKTTNVSKNKYYYKATNNKIKFALTNAQENLEGILNNQDKTLNTAYICTAMNAENNRFCIAQ